MTWNINSDVSYVTPFPAVSAELGTHVTFLDSVGRPSITLRYRDLTVKHAQDIYVGPLLASSLFARH